MPSKYKSKLAKPITKQASFSPRYIPPPQETCSNCGRIQSVLMGKQFSKCNCGGTYQRFGTDRKKNS